VKNESFPLNSFERVFFVGVGKCALEAGAAVEGILGERLSDGIILDVHRGELKKIKTFGGTHPLPSIENERATRAIIGLLEGATGKDLVIFAISGGASTLLCQPQDLTCDEEGEIFRMLMRQGAAIEEINTVRKHLSLARGGYLAKHAYPAKVLSLIFSDVPGDDLEFVASGPTVKDITTVADAKKVFEKFGLEKTHGLIETPKEDKYFEKVKNILLISNKTALEAMAAKARTSGFTPEICTDCLRGEAREEGEKIMAALHKSKPGAALLYGGETTVTVRGNGKGGRNQELALSALHFVKDGEILVSIASDGWDNGEAAGAICDKITKEKAGNLDVEDYLARNDSYAFFEKTGAQIMTGETGSNVSDLIIAIKTR